MCPQKDDKCWSLNPVNFYLIMIHIWFFSEVPQENIWRVWKLLLLKRYRPYFFLYLTKCHHLYRLNCHASLFSDKTTKLCETAENKTLSLLLRYRRKMSYTVNDILLIWYTGSFYNDDTGQSLLLLLILIKRSFFIFF